MKITKLLNPLRWFGRYGVISDIKWWVLHRTVDRYNVIKIRSLKPGYYDTDDRLLHGMFQLLVDYVEEELGCRQYWFDDSKEIIKSWPKLKRFKHWLVYWIPLAHYFVDQRFKDLGLLGVEFYRQYEDEQFPEASQHWKDFGNEVYELYIWWTEVRPNRPDSMDVSGWSELCDRYPLKFEKTSDGNFYKAKRYSDEAEAEMSVAAKKTHEIDEQYEKEDEEMLIRLIKVRRGMWT